LDQFQRRFEFCEEIISQTFTLIFLPMNGIGIVYFAPNKTMKGELHARGRVISRPARNSSWDSSAFGSWSISDARFSASLSQA
jgi:hypothetical protein